MKQMDVCLQRVEVLTEWCVSGGGCFCDVVVLLHPNMRPAPCLLACTHTHTHTGPWRWMLRLWAFVPAREGGLPGRLSYHFAAAAGVSRGPHIKVIGPSPTLEPQLEAGQPGPFVWPVSRSRLGSLSKTTRRSTLQRWRDGGRWRGREREWEETSTEQRSVSEGMIPEKKALYRKKMNRLAFRRRKRMEMGL